MKALFANHLKGDRTIWMVALVLGIVSILAVYSACSWMAWRNDGGTLRVLGKHSVMLAAGGFIMYVAANTRYTLFSRLARLALPVTIALLALTLIIGSNVNGASRWLVIPGLGVTFQTSDLARVTILLYLARVLGRPYEEPWTFKETALRVGLPVAAVCGLILPANFSTAALLGLTCLLVLFVGQVPLKHIGSLAGLGVLAFVLLLLLAKTWPDLLPRVATLEKRIENWGAKDDGVLTPEERDANYQTNNAKIAIVSGGLLPNGPGTGTSRNFMPHPESDMIYAFIIEEYGSILGGLGLLLLYLILMFRSMKVSDHAEKDFGKLAAIGLALSLVLQALVNMAVAVNLLPVTGQPLPLVSMGGTSMWFTCLSIGIILSVSRGLTDVAGPAPKSRPRTAHAIPTDAAAAA